MKKKLLSIFLVTAMTVGLLVGCGNTGVDETGSTDTETNTVEEESKSENTEDESQGEKIVVNVAGMVDTTNEWTSKIADVNGYFEEEFSNDNIEINLVDVGAGPAINEAFLAGQLDIAILGDFPIISGSINGTDIKVISTASYTEQGIGLAVPGDSDITEVSQLKGKKIGLTIGTTRHQQLLRYLEADGLTADDVELINFGSIADAYAAATAGEVDAFTTSDPAMSSEVEKGNMKVLITGDKAGANNGLYVAATNSFLEEHGDIATRFLKTLIRAYNWVNESAENQENAYQLLADYSGIEIDSIPIWFEHFDDSIHLTDEDISHIEATYEFMKENNLVDGELNVSDIVDSSYVNAALQEQ
ncbi:MAG: ABC transporter substrate-binding protein [Clostridiales bacterium]|nr:ABC transporter substrate-binding protein [Clostridiales bacterium]